MFSLLFLYVSRHLHHHYIIVIISNIDLAEIYAGLKLRIQRVRHNSEKDPIPLPKELLSSLHSSAKSRSVEFQDQPNSKLMSSISSAIAKISVADELATNSIDDLKRSGKSTKESSACAAAISAYKEAFTACSQVLSIDKLAFQADWFKSFYRRNYDALMVKSVFDNVIDDVDSVRVWMEALRRGSMGINMADFDGQNSVHSGSMLEDFDSAMTKVLSSPLGMSPPCSPKQGSASIITKPFFMCPEKQKEQEIIDAIIEALFYDPSERDAIKNDPLVRLLISNEPGNYNFTIITAMGVITEGKKGRELQKAIERLEKERGVLTIRADTGTARSVDYNANRIEEAVEQAVKLRRPFGLVGYSQGCANEINFESMMLSGKKMNTYLLLFERASCSLHFITQLSE